MTWKGGRLARRWQSAYRRTSIQMILSASFTAVAVVGMVFMGLTLFLRFSSTSNAQQSENSQRVLAQVNLNLDSYLRSMMRVSDAAYYHVIKDLDLAEEDPAAELELLYESNRDSLVSIALFSQGGEAAGGQSRGRAEKQRLPGPGELVHRRHGADREPPLFHAPCAEPL